MNDNKLVNNGDNSLNRSDRINKKKGNSFGNILIGVLSFLMILSIGFAYIATRLNTIKIDEPDDIGFVQDEDVNMEGDEKRDYYLSKEGITNILVIGVDGSYDDSRSDVMMIATIDENDNVMKLTSVMRDTLANIPTSNTYQKLNHSYMEGGPVETMRAVNKNFDLDIEDFVIFDFNSVEQAVDYIGGLPVNLDSGEARDLGLSEGEHLLSGKQAVMYVRIRKNSGGDTGRNKRQRELIKHILTYSKDMSKSQMIKFSLKMMPLVRTSYSYKDVETLINMYLGLMGETQFEQYSFPSVYEGAKLSDGLWYAVPVNMRENVIKLQEDIFGGDNYTPSRVVDRISSDIESRSGYYK